MQTRTLALAFALVAGATLTACGSGDDALDSSSSSGSTADAYPGGIWVGSDPYSGVGMIGIITESGEFAFYHTDHSGFFGTLTTAGTTTSGSFADVLAIGSAFSDASTYGTGTISATIAARSTITGNTTLTTAAGSAGGSKTLSLTFNSQYNTASSLAAIAGNYTNSTDNSTLSIDAAGVITNQSSTTNCVINGQVTLINATYDAYRISYTYASCTGSYAVLNGLTLTGLGVLDTVDSPDVLYVAIQNATAHEVLAANYTKQ